MVGFVLSMSCLKSMMEWTDGNCVVCFILQAEKKVEEVTTVTRKVGEGEEYFAVAHIFASFNDTFVVSMRVLLILLE